MMKTILVVLLFAASVLAQDQAPTARPAAGCGPNEIKFDVKTDQRQHPIGQPESGKALVYVFADENTDNAGIRIGGLTTRIGLDGAWVGANKGKSYFFFSVDPGDHRLCTNWQSGVSSRSKLGSAAITEEAGKIYYFRTSHYFIEGQRQPGMKLEPLDLAEAQLLIAFCSLSIFQTKK
jgi:hypothetical protein